MNKIPNRGNCKRQRPRANDHDNPPHKAQGSGKRGNAAAEHRVVDERRYQGDGRVLQQVDRKRPATRPLEHFLQSWALDFNLVENEQHGDGREEPGIARIGAVDAEVCRDDVEKPEGESGYNPFLAIGCRNGRGESSEEISKAEVHGVTAPGYERGWGEPFDDAQAGRERLVAGRAKRPRRG